MSLPVKRWTQLFPQWRILGDGKLRVFQQQHVRGEWQICLHYICPSSPKLSSKWIRSIYVIANNVGTIPGILSCHHLLLSEKSKIFYVPLYIFPICTETENLFKDFPRHLLSIHKKRQIKSPRSDGRGLLKGAENMQVCRPGMLIYTLFPAMMIISRSLVNKSSAEHRKASFSVKF